MARFADTGMREYGQSLLPTRTLSLGAQESLAVALESPKTAEAEEDAAAAFSEAAATGTERPSPRPSPPARPSGPPLSNSAARGLAPIRNRRPSNRPRPRPRPSTEPTIDLR